MTDIVPLLNKWDPMLFNRLREEITEDRLYSYLKPLSDTAAPSQTVPWTRARVLRQLIERDGWLHHPNVHFDGNYKGTGNVALTLGPKFTEKRVWMIAHLDEVSYFIEPAVGGRYPLTPLCYHFIPVGRRVRSQALEYSLDKREYIVAGYGDIVTEKDGTIFFEPEGKQPLRAGQRVCFCHELTWDRTTGVVQGSLDDIAGVVPLVLAASVLKDYDVEVLFALSDEEEGPAGAGNQTFCRGVARVLNDYDIPDLVFDVDGHSADSRGGKAAPDTLKPGQGASFAEKGSQGRGGITPPTLYELERKMAAELRPLGIDLQENVGGYVSRTDGGVNGMMRTANVVLLGYLSSDAHYDTQPTTANMKDLVSLARAAVCYALLAHTDLYREVVLAR